MIVKASFGEDMLLIYRNQIEAIQAQIERLQAGNPAETEEVRGLTLHQLMNLADGLLQAQAYLGKAARALSGASEAAPDLSMAISLMQEEMDLLISRLQPTILFQDEATIDSATGNVAADNG